jgi:hypothetical protein
VSTATIANTIRLRFYNEWKTLRSLTDTQMGATSTVAGRRVAWPNKNFDPPAGLSWVRYTLLPATSDQETLAPVGSRTFRHGGRIVVQVFTPDNAGDSENNALCEDAAGIFRGVSAGGVRYAGPSGEAPRIVTVGNDGAGWYQQNVEVQYSADISA